MESYQPLLVSIGDVIDQYRIIDLVGKEKDYEKYLAIHLKLKFFVDVKIFYKSPKLDKLAKLDSTFLTIGNTIDIKHRYFVKFYQHICDQAIPILILEHTGPTLAQQLDYMNGISFNINTVKVIMWQLLHAIELLHESKIICGSISLENISLLGDYVDENGYEKKSGNRSIQVRINSLAYALPGNQWHVDCDTPLRYRAPEALLGTRYSYEIDIWALGVIFIELITGVKLFDTDSTLEHLALIEKMGGSFPDWIFSECPSLSNYFDGGNVNISSLSDQQKENLSKTPTLPELFRNDPLLNFAQVILATDPSARATPTVLYEHPFLQEV